MRKIIILALIYGFALPAKAAGPYDGIWQVPGAEAYMTISENDGVIILVGLAASKTKLWTASNGKRNGNKVRLRTLIGDIEVVADVTMTSDTTLTVTQRSCAPLTPGYACQLPNGYTYTANRVW